MLGKPDLGVEGLLPKMLRVLVETPTVKKVELSAVEAFGHHVARIELFDLYDEDNQTPSWADKKGNTQMDPRSANIVNIKDGNDALQKIEVKFYTFFFFFLFVLFSHFFALFFFFILFLKL